jgi:AcrR family transcriptional regulator
MEGIVGEANLSFGAVYDYYKSKDELILAAFSSAFQEMRVLLVPILMREEPRGRAQMAETWTFLHVAIRQTSVLYETSDR